RGARTPRCVHEPLVVHLPALPAPAPPRSLVGARDSVAAPLPDQTHPHRKIQVGPRMVGGQDVGWIAAHREGEAAPVTERKVRTPDQIPYGAAISAPVSSWTRARTAEASRTVTRQSQPRGVARRAAPRPTSALQGPTRPTH